ncbi:hypothetical protein [Bartonella bovis]|uniref:Apolipoprotein A1/A4/E domain-containing protein n=1 Tax=Bartonella bovis m02 TaxID=1094492 RepID=N6VR68_9HYPH|nr:hypothetical protein [Bartonella bovis]ENN93552.1 hypothetical protein m02_05650 [Bartonella bovis m02]
MARRTKLQAFEVEFEEALEKAMGFNLDDSTSDAILSNDLLNPIHVDDLIQKIATAEEEIFSENSASILTSNVHDDVVIDKSVAEQLFGQKPTDELSGGTVRDTLLPTKPLPANDDITEPLNLGLLKQNSISRIYWSTTALSALWATGGVFVAHKLAPAGLSSLANITSFITSPTGLVVTTGTIIPILMSWGFAQLTKRSTELHNIAVLITHAAQHLSEPRHISEKQAIAIGETIHKEVVAINEGIERTLGRAVELEAIIQGEVHNLEQAYAENESRIHKLIEELNNERTAILNHASRVQSTIKGTQEQLSDEFDLVVSKISTNIDKLTQTLSQTLEKQGEDLVTKLSYVGDDITKQLVEKFNETTVHIQQKNTEFFDELGKNFDGFSERFDNNEKQLEKIFNETTVKAEMHIAKIVENVQTVTDQTLFSIDEKFKTVDTVIIDRHNQSLQNLDEKIILLDEQAHKISSTFDNITSEALEAFENRLATVDLSLKEHGDSIIESFISRSQILEDKVEKLGGFLEAHSLQINANLQERTADIANVFTNGHDNVLSAINESKKLLREEIQNVDDAIVDIIKERSQDFKLQIANQRDIMENMLTSEKDKIADTLRNQIDELTQNVSSIEKTLTDNIQIIDQRAESHLFAIVHCTEKLQETITQSCQTTQDALEKQAKNIDIRAEALRDSLATNSFSLNEVLADQTRTIEQRMETIHHIIAKSDIHIDTALKQQMDLVENVIDNNNKTITEAVQNHIKSLENHTETLKDTLSQSNEILFETFENRIESFDENLENRTGQIFERVTILGETVSEKMGQICETIKEQTSVFEEHSETLKTSIALNNEHTQAMQQTLETSIDNICGTLENSVNTVTGSLHDKVMEASDILASTSEQMLSSLDDETNKVQEKLINASQQAALIMVDQAEKSETSILSASNQFVSSVNDVTTRAENIIFESGNRIASNVEQTIHNTSEKILSVLEEQTAYTAEAFTIASNNAQTLFNEAIHSSTTAVEQLLNERSNVLYQSMQEFENNLGYRLSDISNRLEEANNQTASQVSGYVEQLTELTDYLNQTAQHTTESFGNLTQHISEQLALSTQDAEERIYAQNEAWVNTFVQTNSEAIQTMATMKEDLINNVSAILEQLKQSIYNIHENSNILISTVQNIDTQFNETTNNFFQNTNQAAEHLSNSGQALNNNMEALQGVMQNTFDKISHITTNFSEHAQTLSDTIYMLEKSENTLSATLEGKQNALSTLSNTLVSKSNEINQLIKHYEDALSLAFKRTGENTRNSTQSLEQTLNQLINEVSARFSGAAEDIRKSADEIRLQLLKVNNDINENIQKLPAQTKETIQTVRYTLNEQIAALKDLTNVIQNNDKNSEKDQLMSAMPTSLTSNGGNSTSPETTKKIVPPKPIWSQEQSKSNQNRWVSDLLAGASCEKTQPENANNSSVASPVQTKSYPANGSLNSLATSILQAINHDAIVKLWNHYRRGQKNIITEQIYTSNGKMIFEMIKQKYTSDINFKESVNQYIADFEKLLRDVSRSSGNTRTARQYLISDTGKVYTMLAHASGRIQ